LIRKIISCFCANFVFLTECYLYFAFHFRQSIDEFKAQVWKYGAFTPDDLALVVAALTLREFAGEATLASVAGRRGRDNGGDAVFGGFDKGRDRIGIGSKSSAGAYQSDSARFGTLGSVPLPVGSDVALFTMCTRIDNAASLVFPELTAASISNVDKCRNRALLAELWASRTISAYLAQVHPVRPAASAVNLCRRAMT
jgi:hypothetical protein